MLDAVLELVPEARVFRWKSLASGVPVPLGEGAEVEVTLGITPRVPHVFQANYPILDEATAALDTAAQLLSAHIAAAEGVTA